MDSTPSSHVVCSIMSDGTPISYPTFSKTEQSEPLFESCTIFTASLMALASRVWTVATPKTAIALHRVRQHLSVGEGVLTSAVRASNDCGITEPEPWCGRGLFAPLLRARNSCRIEHYSWTFDYNCKPPDSKLYFEPRLDNGAMKRCASPELLSI